MLACRRMQGRISNDRIADVLCRTFKEFKLQGKVSKVVTDNGSNFVKAFTCYFPPSFFALLCLPELAFAE